MTRHLLHRRRQRRIRRGDTARYLQRDDQFQRRVRTGDARIPDGAAGQAGRAGSYNHYAVGWAHAMNTPTSGPSRWPRISGALATERLCTGQGDQGERRDPAASSLT